MKKANSMRIWPWTTLPSWEWSLLSTISRHSRRRLIARGTKGLITNRRIQLQGRVMGPHQQGSQLLQ
jgi:hypothetical protein